MEYLGISTEELTAREALFTAKEISQQPEVWEKVWADILALSPSIQDFFIKSVPVTDRIILTGAGTSAYIGTSLKGIFQQKTGIITEAIASTDIVTHPENYFMKNETILLVSFARSGNSPESVAVVKLADTFCAGCTNLIITCNSEGELARYPTRSEKKVIVLPEEANDRSLVMTSSYSGMLLAGLLIAMHNELNTLEPAVHVLIKYARHFINDVSSELKRIASTGFTRAVFLGSGCFNGTAKEASLKLQELTEGKVICKSDSYLGFRHGPKAVINERTLLIYFLSSGNEYAFRYEKDFIDSMKEGTQPMLQISVSESVSDPVPVEDMLYFTEDDKSLDDEWLAMCYIIPVQIIGFYKSLELGLSPDNPSSNNDITRVVQGVNIYSLT